MTPARPPPPAPSPVLRENTKSTRSRSAPRAPCCTPPRATLFASGNSAGRGPGEGRGLAWLRAGATLSPVSPEAPGPRAALSPGSFLRGGQDPTSTFIPGQTPPQPGVPLIPLALAGPLPPQVPAHWQADRPHRPRDVPDGHPDRQPARPGGDRLQRPLRQGT